MSPNPEAATVLPDHDGYIDMTPSDDGFAALAVRFVDQVLQDIRPVRLHDDRFLLEEVVKIAFLLGEHGKDDLAVRIVKHIRGDRP